MFASWHFYGAENRGDDTRFEKMTIDEKQSHLKRVAADLGEHFDCVQILAHDSDSDTYQTFEAGSGSLYARMYQAMRWSEHPTEAELIEEDDEDES
jgi:hypothetical protein